MDKVLELGELLDWYGMLLTERQRSITSQYADENCTLAEIAEREHISRQGVRDTLGKAEQQLRNYESALHLIERFQKHEKLSAAMRAVIRDSALPEEQKEPMQRALDALEAIWEE